MPRTIHSKVAEEREPAREVDQQVLAARFYVFNGTAEDAAVLDEALGAAAWMAGHLVVVARLAVDMRQMVPLGIDATIDARVERVAGRKVYCRAELTNGTGMLAEGEALCVILAPEQAAGLQQ